MNLFLKIFLWFLAAIILMIGVLLFLNWTVQTEPTVSRWRVSVRNQTNLYSTAAAQIFEDRGEEGLTRFLEQIRGTEGIIGEVDVVGEDGKVWAPRGVDVRNYDELIKRTFASSDVEMENREPESALTAKRFTSNGKQYIMILRWERAKIMPFFGESPLRYLRYGGLLLTALLLCWLLAKYISSPIGKLRDVTHRFADGELSARVADEVGNRRDEISALAEDFDAMAERIESLITAQKRLSMDISHELRSPLARMNVALEIAKQKSGAETQPLLKRIESESTRLNEMIGRLLTLSRLETDQQAFEKTKVNLKKLVEQVVADADFEANARGRGVVIENADECDVNGNEGLLRSAVENVLRNAARYTAEGTKVSVGLNAENGKAVIDVVDHGSGVPEGELKNLFKPFYRVSEARDRGSGGIGLGLAIAEQAVLAHGGTINAANTGDGLSVRIELKTMPPSAN